MAKDSQWFSNKKYNSIFGQIPRLCVDVVIKSKQGVVLSWREIEPAKNTWHIPGGRVYFRESLDNAVKRIVKEETGLKVKPGKVVGVIEYIKEIQNGHKRHTVSIVYEAVPIGGDLRGSRQAEKVKFFKTLPQKTFKPHGEFIKKRRKASG
jgi:ADP-ribose pyrophosphatase YjhB (NUDIX family)